MQVIIDKGLVGRELVCRTDIYPAATARQEAQRTLLADLLGRAFGDSAKALVSRALDVKRLPWRAVLNIHAPITKFLSELHQLRVLDPACGSGNFLYVALQSLKDLEHEVVTFAEHVGSPGLRLLGPKQFHGIEISPFARELASMVVWIGYLQWNIANGITSRESPILKPLGNIVQHDALMSDDGTEFEWPPAKFIIGNPPFLGGKRLRSELGDEYVDRLFTVFDGQVARDADLVTYWFEKARKQVQGDKTERVGLIATNSIRGGANRTVLDRIKQTGDIFAAWSDEPWMLDGAAVRVSIVGFDDGSEIDRHLNGMPVLKVNSNLTDLPDITKAKRLPKNAGNPSWAPRRAGPLTFLGSLRVPGSTCLTLRVGATATCSSRGSTALT